MHVSHDEIISKAQTLQRASPCSSTEVGRFLEQEEESSLRSEGLPCTVLRNCLIPLPEREQRESKQVCPEPGNTSHFVYMEYFRRHRTVLVSTKRCCCLFQLQGNTGSMCTPEINLHCALANSFRSYGDVCEKLVKGILI